MLLSPVTVADLDSSDSSRLYPNERYALSNSIPTKVLHSAPKEVFTSKIEKLKVKRWKQKAMYKTE